MTFESILSAGSAVLLERVEQLQALVEQLTSRVRFREALETLWRDETHESPVNRI